MLTKIYGNISGPPGMPGTSFGGGGELSAVIDEDSPYPYSF